MYRFFTPYTLAGIRTPDHFTNSSALDDINHMMSAEIQSEEETSVWYIKLERIGIQQR
jgi:hypothetical protein